MLIKDINRDTPIASIICESNITGFTNTNIIKMDNGKAIGEGQLQRANEKNRNGRFYSSEELFPQLTAPRTLELLEAGYLRAELGHPLSKDLARQQTIDDSRTTAMFLKLWTKGDEVMAQFRGTNNAFGDAFNKDLLDGCKPAWSLRALGTVVNTERGAEVKNLRIITWDQVIYPSHPGAYTRGLITIGYAAENDVKNESAIIPVITDDLINLIQNESANIKMVKDSLDFTYNNMYIDKNARKVTLEMTYGDIIVIPLEKYVSNEIRNYASSMSKFI